MAQYLDIEGVKALWKKTKEYADGKAAGIDLSPYLKTANLATVNGQSLSNGGNVTIDLTLFKVVDKLPTANIDETKIYLVKSAENTTGNVYSEYIYTGEAWEELGTYKSEVDLSPYAKTADVNASLATKVDKVSGKGLSTNDFTAAYKAKLDGIASGANNYTLPKATSSALGGVMVGYTANGRNYAVQLDSAGKAFVAVPWTDTNTTYSVASSTADGLMSASDKAKLDSIAQGANQYTLPTAAASTLGGVKTGYTTSGKNYAVVVDANGNAYVNVPWTDNNTTYGNATTSTAGLMSAADKTKLDGVASGATADSAIPTATIEALA